jgi:deazaflavin-dependent oxidoreductase (nitroreductase family)
MNVKQSAADLRLKSMNAVHKCLLAISGGRIGQKLAGMQTVRLHTVGRNSGKPREAMLMAPIFEDDRVVLVASKGGDDRNPEWYLNLSADPDIELTIQGTRTPWRARTATTDEKAELWPRITSTYKGYAGYQKRTDRDIPVVICEPRGD